MKILFFSSYPNFSGSHKMALSLAKAAKEAGHEVIVGAPEDNLYLEKAQAAGLQTHIYQAPQSLLPTGGKILKGPNIARTLLDLVPYNLKILKTAKEQNLDMAYIAQERGVLQIGTGLKLSGVPILWHLQGGLKNNLKPLHKLASSLSQRIICVSDAVNDDLAGFISQKDTQKVTTIHNGLPDIEQKANRSYKLTNILFAGNVVPERGAHILLEAAMSLPNDRTKITIAGWLNNPAYEDYLRSMIDQYDLQNVELCGYRDDIEDLMNQSDIVVCPSIDEGSITLEGQTKHIACKEGFGLTALEAMRASKPVICSDIYGLKEVVEDKVSGLYVPADDVVALSDALDTLVNDKALREKLGKAGRQRYEEHFSDNKMIDAFLNVLEEFNA